MILRRGLAALLLLIAPIAIAAELTPREREAFEYLRSTDTFAKPYVNIGGNYPGQYHALRILDRSAGADAAFKELVRLGTTAGQLYGLIGLYRTDPAAFREAVASFTNSQEMVPSFVGCVTEPERVADIVHSEHAIDIAHGGYTAMFFGPAARGDD